MSKIIAANVIAGAHKVYEKTRKRFEQAVQNIQPTQNERMCGVTADHLIDDYTMSRNIAKYGLRFTTFFGIMQDLKHTGEYFWHQYLVPVDEKVKQINEVLIRWGLKKPEKIEPPKE